MKVISAVVRVLSWLVLTIVALTLLLIAPLVAGYHPVVVLSGSMMPNYPVGSVTYYKSAAYEDISVGDAITFRIGDGQELATHRVTAKDDAAQSFTTKGDHNETEDANPVSYSQVAGKTTGLAVPYVGYFCALRPAVVCTGHVRSDSGAGYSPVAGKKAADRWRGGVAALAGIRQSLDAQKGE